MCSSASLNFSAKLEMFLSMLEPNFIGRCFKNFPTQATAVKEEGLGPKLSAMTCI